MADTGAVRGRNSRMDKTSKDFLFDVYNKIKQKENDNKQAKKGESDPEPTPRKRAAKPTSERLQPVGEDVKMMAIDKLITIIAEKDRLNDLKKKEKKELSEERKAQLREQLARGRAKMMQNKQKAAADAPKFLDLGSADAHQPAAEVPKAAVEVPKQVAEAPKPVAEVPKPVAEVPRPVAEVPKPVAEVPKPAEPAKPFLITRQVRRFVST